MTDSREMLKIACAALEEKKAFDIKIINISKISTLCDYIVIADGTNKKQVQALSDNVEDKMSAAGYSHKGVEGYSDGGWILLDYYDIIVHIFSEESRRFYNIEKIWNDGETVSMDSLSWYIILGIRKWRVTDF